MGAEPGRPNGLSPITRIDTARVRPVQSAAGRSFIEPGSPWQNPLLVGQVRGLPPLPRRPATLMAFDVHGHADTPTKIQNFFNTL